MPKGTSRRTTYSCSSVSWATSGTVIVPLTSSSSLVLPSLSAWFGQSWLSEHTGVLDDEFDIEDGDNLALTLVDINIPIHTDQLVQLSSDAIVLSLDVLDLLLQIRLAPCRGILIDPMPVIRIVQHSGQLLRFVMTGESLLEFVMTEGSLLAEFAESLQ